MTEYGDTNIPLTLSNSASSGAAAKGTVWNTNGNSPALPDWTNNPGGYPSAIHFHGEPSGQPLTQITTSNSTLFNFTNNPFTINVWLRPYMKGVITWGMTHTAQTDGICQGLR